MDEAWRSGATMSNQVLEKVLSVIEGDPHSASSLTLFALVSTLEFEKAGYLFKLAKLRDLSASERQMAYELMELMAEGGNKGTDWEQGKARMDALIRNA